MAFPYSEGSDYAESLLSAKLLFMESVFPGMLCIQQPGLKKK